MPEGTFKIITQRVSQDNVDTVVQFLAKKDIKGVLQKSVGKEYVEISADSALEFSLRELAALCQPLIKGDDWFRVYSSNEYGTEEF